MKTEQEFTEAQLGEVFLPEIAYQVRSYEIDVLSLDADTAEHYWALMVWLFGKQRTEQSIKYSIRADIYDELPWFLFEAQMRYYPEMTQQQIIAHLESKQEIQNVYDIL